MSIAYPRSGTYQVPTMYSAMPNWISETDINEDIQRALYPTEYSTIVHSRSLIAPSQIDFRAEGGVLRSLYMVFLSLLQST